MKVLIIGAGAVGITNAIGLSRMGHEVFCYDRQTELLDPQRLGGAAVRFVSSLICPSSQIVNPELPSAFDAFVICVGTPNLPEATASKGAADSQLVQDLSQLRSALIEICEVFSWEERMPWDEPNQRPLVVVRSTILPRTSVDMVVPLLETHWGKDQFDYAFMPEFLREGSELRDFTHPDRLVVGCLSPVVAEKVRDLFWFPDSPWIEVNPTTAEMIKYMANTLLTVQISAANELANLCERTDGVDLRKAFAGTLLDGRWQNGGIREYVHPGIGFGGPCLPKDLEALLRWSAHLKVHAPTLQGAQLTNISRVTHLIEDWESRWGAFTGRRVLVLGLTFKPNSVDHRGSRSLELVSQLLTLGARVQLHDPSLAASPVAGADWAVKWQTALPEQDFVILATPWKEYQSLPQLLSRARSSAHLIDARWSLKTQATPPDARSPVEESAR